MNQQLLSDNENIEEVIKRYSDMVYRLAFARVGNSFDADEVYQEVFLRLIRKKPVFRGEEHRKAWLIKVTINCSKKLLGSTWKKRTTVLDDTVPFYDDEKIELYQELQKLSSDARTLIHLYYFEDMKSSEIAKLLNRKESTVRTQLTRARQQLKKFMKEEDYV